MTNIYINFAFQSIKLYNFLLVRRQDEGAIRFRKKRGTVWVEFVSGLTFLFFSN